MRATSRRRFLRDLGLSTAVLPFVTGLPGLAAPSAKRKQRLVILFSPDGTVPWNFWPKEEGKDFTLPEILTPLAAYKNKLLTLNGVCDRVHGDGDAHMRGMGCLLTGIELFPGNIQGGGDTPAGWSSGLSIDQEIKNFLQSNPATRTRFGSLELGVMVPERADTWTRMVYGGPNKPIAPIDDPQQVFQKLYGQAKDQQNLRSVLDDLQDDLKKVSAKVGKEDRQILSDHASLVRELEKDLQEAAKSDQSHPVPVLEPGVRRDNDNIPRISKQQIDLMVASFQADFTRVATLQYTNSVGQARFRWLDISEGQHDLSHEPDSNTAAQEKLTKINKWYCEQLAYLAKRLAETPEPGGTGSMLDNTLIVWTNELGQGNSHTLNNIPFLLLGGAPGFTMGRSLKFKQVAHNRLLMSIAHGFDHRITKFGKTDFCGEGPLNLSA
ncbi:MAG: DUF1552 domain-containing protein [Armatimonas sp.]